MELQIKVALPMLWTGEFQKNAWGVLNFLVGPNGTGKTLFAADLKKQCEKQGLKPRYLNAERLAGLERQNYGHFNSSSLAEGFTIRQFETYKSHGQEYGLSGDAFILLNEKLDLKARVEATLGQLFDRELTLSTETGTLQPKLRLRLGEPYDMRQHECHGLKELITLLTFLYDDGNNCLVIDEPELHLHPQFQMFLLQHIRQIAGDPRVDSTKKLFFLITHSPFLVDVRTISDLSNCVIFRSGALPSFVESLATDDEYKVKRLLPRLNTHHKQFFFASAPTFVEGYTDQQLLGLMQEQRGKLMGAVGSCLIDVMGKDELAVFFSLCRSLKIEGRFIADLDVLFSGNLRQLVSADSRCRQVVQQRGLGEDGNSVVGQIERSLSDCIVAAEASLASQSDAHAPFLTHLTEALASARREADTGKQAAKQRYIMALAALGHFEDIRALIPAKGDTLTFVRGRLESVIEAYKAANVFVLRRGEIENYLPSMTANPFQISASIKSDCFDRERTFLLEETAAEEVLRERYGELIDILDEVSRSPIVDVGQQLERHLSDWIHRVQSAFRRNPHADQNALLKDPLVDWKVYTRLFEVVSFAPNGGGFQCRVRFKPSVDPYEREVSFTADHVPSQMRLPAIQDSQPADLQSSSAQV